MKKIIGVFLLLILCFLFGCEQPLEKEYSLDLSSIEETMELSEFDVSLIRIKEIVGENVNIINCNESMFTESDYQKLQTVGTHTVSVLYKLFKGEFTITLIDSSVNEAFTYSLDLSKISVSMNIDSFDLSLLSISKKFNATGDEQLIPCNESMLSQADLEKLQTVGTHTVIIQYEKNTFEFTITLYENQEVITYSYALDLGYLRDQVLIDDFDLNMIIIKESDSKGNVKYIECDETMLSQEDLAKLKTVGTHTITVNYKEFSDTVTVTLIEQQEVITYSYELDLGYLRDQVLIDDFDLNMIVIKESDSKGNVKYIECDETMLSQADLAKLKTVGTHTITVNYNNFNAEVTIVLIDPNNNDNTDPVVGAFSSNLSYYASANGLKGTELKSKLRTIITTTHKKVTTYAELKTYLQKADEDPNNKNNMLLFYNGVSVEKSANMNIWNREHVWPKSLGWFSESGAGADMHHLRPCNPGVNSSRGNTKFGTSSGYYDPSKFGVDYRGDVARILFYLFVRYTEADRYTFTSVAQSKEMLLEWNKLDPVSETEIIRNDYTYTIQGNRNPFIDHPETADLIWGTTSLLNNNIEFAGYEINVVMYIEEKKKYEYA